MLVAYAAAKAGLWAVTQSMAKELAEHRILVNAVTPGATITAERIAALHDGTFVSSQVPPEAVKTREMIQNKVDSGAFAQMLTPVMPLGRPGYPADIAKAVLFLASEMASYISGACLTVDGAQSLC
jgi:NAD(P)-dependent dehydrogenase (short-subunit alcohol dehydrogenase family)